LTPHVLADDNLSRINRSFNARGRVDTITVEIAVCIYGDIADMNTYAQIVCTASLCGFLSILFAMRLLRGRPSLCLEIRREPRLREI